MSQVLMAFQEQIGTVTFNNAERRNCLSNSMLEEISAAIGELVERKARVILLRAPKGSAVWSAGFDVRDLPEPGRDPLSYNDELGVALRAVQMAPCPVVAMIEGSVWGGACDLAVTCDLVIGCPSATFAITPAKLGVPTPPRASCASPTPWACTSPRRCSSRPSPSAPSAPTRSAS